MNDDEAAEIQYNWDKSLPDPQPPPAAEVVLTGEPSIYEKMPPPVHEFPMENLKPFLMKKLHEAYSAGHLGKTAKHYAKELDAAGALDYWTLEDFKDLADEAHESRHDKAELEVINSKIRELVGNFTVTKRRKW